MSQKDWYIRPELFFHGTSLRWTVIVLLEFIGCIYMRSEAISAFFRSLSNQKAILEKFISRHSSRHKCQRSNMPKKTLDIKGFKYKKVANTARSAVHKKINPFECGQRKPNYYRFYSRFQIGPIPMSFM